MPPRKIQGQTPHDRDSAIRLRRKQLTEEFKVTVFRTDCRVHSKRKPKIQVQTHKKKRGKTGNAPSRESLRRLVFVLNNADIPFVSFLTFTMPPEVNEACSVDEHKKVFSKVLQKMRSDNFGEYVWVREFQENGSLHWHAFATCHVGEPGEVNNELSIEWSKYFAGLYRKAGKASGSTYRKMTSGEVDGFRCVRVEMLRSDAGGRYAAKEGAKRYQKLPPEKWRGAGANWWGKSRGVKVTPVGEAIVQACELVHVTVKLDHRELEFPAALQYGLGLKINDHPEQYRGVEEIKDLTSGG